MVSNTPRYLSWGQRVKISTYSIINCEGLIFSNITFRSYYFLYSKKMDRANNNQDPHAKAPVQVKSLVKIFVYISVIKWNIFS